MDVRGTHALVIRRRVAAVGAAAALLLSLLPLTAPAAQAASASASLVVAPRDGGLLQSGDDLDLDVEVTNTGTTALSKGTLRFSLAQQPVAGASTLVDSITHPAAILLGGLLPEVATAPALQPGAAAHVHVTIKHDDLTGILAAASGSSLLYVRYRSGGEVVQTVAESAVTRMAKGFTGTVAVGTVIALTAPANATGVVDTAAQATLTAPGGAWDTALAAAEADPSATVALDPEVIASIRLAGTTAPSTATDFLAALKALPNEVVRLPYGDADQTLERSAGTAGLVAPASFAGASTAAATSSATPAPTPTTSAGRAVTTSAAALTDWSWSTTAVAWPVPGTTSGTTLAAMGRDDTTVLLGSGDVRVGATALQTGPRGTIGGVGVLVADTTTSALLARAASGGIAGDAALATLVGALGADTISGEARGVLLVPGRSTDLPGLPHALAVLRRASWITGTGLTSFATGTASTVALAPHAVPAARVATARTLLQQEGAVQSLGAAAGDGTALVAPERLALTGLLSSAWRGEDAAWAAAAAGGVTRFDAFVGQVAIASASSATYLGNDGNLPVTVTNGLAQPVTVIVHGRATNGRLQVTGDTRVTVPAGSSRPAKLPITSITNGRVQVDLWLTTPTGTVIGGTSTRTITVQAGFETVVAVLLIAALGLLFLTGVYRNVIRRRRKPRQVPA